MATELLSTPIIVISNLVKKLIMPDFSHLTTATIDENIFEEMEAFYVYHCTAFGEVLVALLSTKVFHMLEKSILFY